MKKFLSTLILLATSVSMASATRILDGQQITNGAAVLSLPSVTTTLDGIDTTATLTNKTISGATNTISNVPASAIASGTIAIANGGTGQATASAAFTALAPSQTAANGQFLTSNGTVASWAAIPSSAPSVTGTNASPTLVLAAVGIAFTGTAYENYAFVAGSAAPQVITANPQIAAGTNVGQRFVLIGKSATNTVTLSDGSGLSLNGPIVLGLDSSITLVWTGASWSELSRR